VTARQETAGEGRSPHAKEAGAKTRCRRRRRRRRRRWREEVQEQLVFLTTFLLVFLAIFLLVVAPFFCRGGRGERGLGECRVRAALE
jgi:hypothetical protein